MTVRKQHYVPRVYLKNWETQVVSKKEPYKKFVGVYYYERNDLTIGDGRNNNSILWKQRLYTVNYNLFLLLFNYCPIIKEDYVKQIKENLRKRNVDAFLNGKELKTQNDISNSFLYLDDWEFRYTQYPFNLAKKTAILNDIKQINSYVIESALDDVVEKKWQKSLNDFIHQIENTIPLNQTDDILQIDENAVIEIVKMVIFLMCRNPEFNCVGIFPGIREALSNIFPETVDLKGQENRKDNQDIMEALWLVEIYRSLFNVQAGFFHELKQTIQSSFQIVLLKCWENQGEFITSDMPAFEHISLIEDTNINSIICPLTPQYIIMLMKGENNSLRNIKLRYANNDLIRRFNTIILNHSKDAIISNYKYLGYIL